MGNPFNFMSLKVSSTFNQFFFSFRGFVLYNSLDCHLLWTLLLLTQLDFMVCAHWKIVLKKSKLWRVFSKRALASPWRDDLSHAVGLPYDSMLWEVACRASQATKRPWTWHPRSRLRAWLRHRPVRPRWVRSRPGRPTQHGQGGQAPRPAPPRLHLWSAQPSPTGADAADAADAPPSCPVWGDETGPGEPRPRRTWNVAFLRSTLRRSVPIGLVAARRGQDF